MRLTSQGGRELPRPLLCGGGDDLDLVATTSSLFVILGFD